MPFFLSGEADYWQVPERFRLVAEKVSGARIGYYLLGPDEEDTPIAMILEMPPGYVIPRHAHERHRFEVVLNGSIAVGDTVLHAGDVMTAGPGEQYGPKTAGPDGCTTVEVFRDRRSASVTVYEMPDGSLVPRDLTAADPIPDGFVG